MKKLILVAAVLVAALPLAFSQGKLITVRALVPIDFAGTTHSENSDYDLSEDYDTKIGFGLGAEAMVGVWKELKVGGGFQYQFGHSIDNSAFSSDNSFNFVPVYGIVAYGFKLPVVNTYVIGRVGYNLFMGNDEFKNGADLKGGIYFTLGGGASFNIPGVPVKPFVELNYAIDNGQADNGSGITATDVSYRRLQVAAGASFSL